MNDATKINAGRYLGFLSRERVSGQLLEAVRKAVISNPNRFKGLLLVGKVSVEFKSLVDKMGMKDMIHYFRFSFPERCNGNSKQSCCLACVGG
jgi:hypothetical protein